ncbi:MAG: hypothetical protein NTY38_21870 [Acidobacteria bacterium]|nr:hypothetical protein [Acidobacteriota bacterium]
MTHSTAPDFWIRYHALPSEVQVLADRAFAVLKTDPRHPSLHFKKADRFWSVRVGLHYRALAVEVPGGALWFWIGSHAEYDGVIG